MEEKTTCFTALGDATRLHILRVIALNKRMRAKDLLEYLSITQPTLSHHMRLLSEEKLVLAEKTGRECFYSVNRETIRGMVDALQKLTGDAEKAPVPVVSAVKASSSGEEKKKKGKEKKDKKKKKKEKNK